MLGEDVEDLDPGGGIPEGIGALIQIGSAGGVAFWGRDVGIDPPDGAGPENISEQGRKRSHWEAAKAAWGGELETSFAGGGNGRSGL